MMMLVLLLKHVCVRITDGTPYLQILEGRHVSLCCYCCCCCSGCCIGMYKTKQRYGVLFVYNLEMGRHMAIGDVVVVVVVVKTLMCKKKQKHCFLLSTNL